MNRQSREPGSRGDGDRGKGSERCEGREVRNLLERGILDTWPGFRVALGSSAARAAGSAMSAGAGEDARHPRLPGRLYPVDR